MILSCHHITKAFLEDTVLSDITFHLEKGDKAAIVGVNGAGKSTLLKIITGELAADEGQVAIERGATWGYLAQNQNLDSDRTIWEELLTVKKDVIDLEEKIHRDEDLMTKLTGTEQTRIIEEYNDLLQRFQRENGYAYKGEITGVLKGLGFDEHEFGQKIHTLSGGQKTRVALAKLLLENPDIIMLDEPTNHLDIGSISWLETYLSNYKGTVLIVSHDRYFLDKCVTKIIEIENTKATVFSGNYSFYAERKKALREEAWHHYLNNQAEIKHQEEVITKLRQFNREKSIKRADSREKMLQKMDKVDKPIELRDDMRLTLRPCIRSGRDVCEVRHISKSFDNKHLFTDISFNISRGEHVAILGDNGTGKSTLLKIIIGQLQPDDGAIRFGTNVHLGYYDQEHHVLNNDNTVFEEIAQAYPDMTNTEIRNLLASFLFTNDDVFKKIGDLSGGEKGRVSLAKLMLSEANFLILDEPTNHLDMVSKEVLENALNSYEGTVLYVSHDRYFINHTASRILNLTGRLLLNYPGGRSDAQPPECYIGNYDFFLEKSAQVEGALARDEIRRIQEETGLSADKITETFSGGDGIGHENNGSAGDASARGGSGGNGGGAASAGSGAGNGSVTGSSRNGASIGSPDNGAAGANDWQRQKEEQAKARKLANELKKCEDRINQLETRNAAIDEEMAQPDVCTDIAKLNQLQKEKTANEQELEGLYEKWEELQE